MFTLDPKIEAFNEIAYQSALVQQVLKKYYWPKGNESKPDDIYRRVAKAIAQTELNYSVLGDIPEQVKNVEETFYQMMSKRLWIPGGRICAGAGTDKRVTLMNCLQASTKFYTRGAVLTLEEAYKLGGSLEVLTSEGWAKATIQEFGVQKLNNVEFAPIEKGQNDLVHKFRKVVQATPEHRWFLNNNRTTNNLMKGDRIPFVTPDIEESNYAEGFKHGLVFGDGQLHRTTKRDVGFYRVGTMHFVLRLCGEKAKYLSMFAGENVKFPPAAKGDPIVYLHSMENLRDIPKNKSIDYIRGFIDGWFAMDGHTPSKNVSAISTSNFEAVEWFEDQAALVGYIQVGKSLRREAGHQTNLGTLKKDLWEVRFRPGENMEWVVTDIQDSGLEETVYCAVVPGLEQFTLAGGILTSNCYVNRSLEDSMEGIGHSLMDLRLTMQQGGGMGTAFETLRPAGAMLKRTQSRASGILPFMDEYNSTSRTIMSAGDRSGAMMGTISDTHPDLPAFIKAKAEGAYFTDDAGVQQPLPYHLRRWSQFNVSILVSDAFMAAVDDDEDWILYFHVDTFEKRSEDLQARDFIDEEGKQQYVYSVWKARELWDLITEYTYKYSDPGIIFIDRVNDWNNLGYVETIRCTNPCGEQPLPPNGTCNLGAINLSQLVLDPFTSDARIDWDLLETVTTHGVRFLDNVIEVTGYPLEAQKEEEYNKRRIGLGITGFGTMLAELQVKYGSLRSLQIAEKVMKTIAHAAYRASINLAKERGSFPLFDAEAMLNQKEAFVTRLPLDIQNGILTTGLRNGVLLTIAPVGTGSIAFGCNATSGLEPDFMHEALRNVRKGSSDEFESYIEKSYTKRFYEFCTGDDSAQIPEYMATALEISVSEHIQVQAALQKWVDASVSKTINVPMDIPVEDFKDVYKLAYDSGCKGCTTYRPTPDRMSILSGVSDTDDNKTLVIEPLMRGDELEGTTYKIKWPSMSASMYVTINYMNDKPYEIFFASKDAKYQDWMTGLTLMISAIFRTNIDPAFVPQELKQVISTHDTAWNQGKFVGSLVARIGQVIEQDFIKRGIIEGHTPAVGARLIPENKGQVTAPAMRGSMCPSCGQPSLLHIEGCKKCTNCGHSAC